MNDQLNDTSSLRNPRHPLTSQLFQGTVRWNLLVRSYLLPTNVAEGVIFSWELWILLVLQTTNWS